MQVSDVEESGHERLPRRRSMAGTLPQFWDIPIDFLA